MPLAGHDDDSRTRGLAHAGADGLHAVEHDLPVVVALLLDKVRDGVADVGGVLGAGIVLGDHDAVGELAGGDTHGLATVHALAARGAKDHGELAVGVVLTQVAQHGLEAHAVVGKVHHAHDLAALCGVELHAAGHAQVLKAVHDGLLLDAERLGAGDGPQHVGDVELDGRGYQDIGREARGAHRGRDARRTVHERLGIDICLRVLERIGDGACADGRSLEHTVHVVHVQVHHGAVALGEQLELARKVVFERGVLDGRDVVLADVGESAHGELHAVGAVVLERLARGLHDHVLAAADHRVAQAALQLEGLGRGELGDAALHAVVEVDAREQRAFRAAGHARVQVEHAFEIVGARGLALGAREGAHLGLA